MRIYHIEIFRNPSPLCGPRILTREKNIEVRINNNIVKRTKCIKYLGIHFSNLLNANTHVKHALKKAAIAKAMLSPVMNINSKIDPQIKMSCYKQIIRPQFVYGFPMWFNFSANQMNKIRIFERKCLRQCINFKRTNENYKYISNTELYKKANIIPIDEFLIKIFIKFIENIANVPNKLIQDIYEKGINNPLYFEQCYRQSHRRYFPPIGLSYLIENRKIFNSNNKLIFYGEG